MGWDGNTAWTSAEDVVKAIREEYEFPDDALHELKEHNVPDEPWPWFIMTCDDPRVGWIKKRNFVYVIITKDEDGIWMYKLTHTTDSDFDD